MKAGIESTYYKNPDGQIDYEMIARHGYSYVDYGNLCDTANGFYAIDDATLKAAMEAELRKAKAAGLAFSQVHGPWPIDDTTEEKRIQGMAYFQRCVRATAWLEATHLVVHPKMPYGWGDEADPHFAWQVNRDFLTALTDYARDLGVVICLENMPFKRQTLSHVPMIVKIVEELSIDNLKICLDTGHSNLYGGDLGEMVRLCGRNLAVLHVHDNHGGSDEHQLPYLGNIKWVPFLEALKEIGYPGVLSLEVCFRTECPEPLKSDIRAMAGRIAQEMCK